MTIARLGSQDCSDAGTGTCTPTYPVTATARDLLICTISSPQGTSGANSCSGFSVATDPHTGQTSDLALGNGTSGGDLTLVYKQSAGTEKILSVVGSGAMQAHAYEYSGAYLPVFVDALNSNSSGISNVTTLSTGQITTLNAGDLVIVCLGMAGTNGGITTPWTSATQLTSTTKLYDGEYLPKSLLSNFSDSAIWATGRQSGGLIVAFRPVEGNGGFFAAAR